MQRLRNRCGLFLILFPGLLHAGGPGAAHISDTVMTPVYDRFVDALSPCVRRDRHPGACPLPERLDITDLPGSVDQLLSAETILDTVESQLGRAFDAEAVQGIRERLTTAMRGELPRELAQTLARGESAVRRTADRVRARLPGKEFARFKHQVLETTIVRLPNPVYGAILSGSAARHFAEAFCGPGCFNAHEFKRGVEVTRVMLWQFKHREEIALSLRQLVDLGARWQSALKIPDLRTWGALGRNMAAAQTRLADLEGRLAEADRLLMRRIDAAESALLQPMHDLESRLLSLQRDLLTPAHEAVAAVDKVLTTVKREFRTRLPPWLHGVPKDWATFKERMGIDLHQLLREKRELSPEVTSAESVPPQHVSAESPFDPVLLHNGEFYHRVVDVVIPARGLPLRWERIYRSRHDFSGPLGRNWTHNYHERLLRDRAAARLTWFGADGTKVVFTRGDDGRWIAPRGVFLVLCERHVNDAPEDGLRRTETCGAVSDDGDSRYALLHPDGRQTDFAADGRMRTQRDRYGNRLRFHYDPTGALSAVEDATGRRMTIQSDRAGRVTAVTDWKQRTWRYRYDARGDLVAATMPATEDFPDGTTTRYEYSAGASTSPLAHNLTAIIDPKGQRYLENVYGTGGLARDRVVAQRYGAAAFPLQARYALHRVGWGAPATAVVATTRVTDRRGIAHLYAHNAQGELLRTWLIDSDGRVHDVIAHRYDAEGRRVRTQHPDGSGMAFRFAPATRDRREAGNLVRTTRTGAAGERRAYSARYRPQSSDIVQLRDPLGRTVRITYAGAVPVGRQLADGRRERYVHDRYGQRIRIRHSDGTETHVAYTDHGAIAAFTEDATGIAATTRYRYDAVGNISDITDPEGHTRRVVVNARNQMTARYAPDAARARERYTYDANDNLHRIDTVRDDGSTTTVEMEYDALDHLIARHQHLTATDRITTRYTYDANDNLVAITWPEQNRTLLTYDAWNRLAIVGIGNVANQRGWHIQYDANGRLAAWISPGGAMQQFRYDAFGQLTEQVDAMGTVRQREYDRAGRAVRDAGYDAATQPLTDTRYTYDDGDRLVARQRAWWRDDPAAAEWVTERWTYDARDRVLGMTDALGAAWRVTRDGLGRPTRIRNPVGHELALQFDRRGLPTAATIAPPQATTRWKYDARGLRTAEVDPLGAITRFTYDATDNLTARVDPEGRRTEWTYDALGRPLQHRVFLTDARPAGPLSLQGEGQGEGHGATPSRIRQTTFAWDGNHRLAHLTDTRGDTTDFDYDAADRLRRVRYPDGTERHHTYDPDGRLHETIEPDQAHMAYAYNPAGLLVQETARRGEDTVTHHYAYDPLGRMVAAQEQERDQRATFRYDSLSHRIAESSGPHRVTQSVDPYGRVLSRRLRDGPAESRQYDAVGRLAFVASGDFHARYAYAGWQPYTTADFSTGAQLHRAWDGNGRLQRQWYRRSGQEVWREAYQYDRAGLMTMRETTPPAQRWTYAYDDAAQLIAAQRQSPQGTTAWRWDYDDLGERRAPALPVLTHDRNGQLVQDDRHHYQYDPFGRLTGVQSAGVPPTHYRYDALRRRIGEERAGEDDVTWFAPGWSELARYHRGARSQYFLRGAGPDDLIAIADDTGWHPVIQDDVRSVRALDGPDFRSYDYTPYGEPLTTAPLPLAFAGRPYDPGLGLGQFRHRDYSPALGRFLTRDPLGWQMPFRAHPTLAANGSRYQHGHGMGPARSLVPFSPWESRAVTRWNPSTNHYWYAGNNPVNFTDPDGRQITMTRTEHAFSIDITVDFLQSPDMPENMPALFQKAVDTWWAHPANYEGPPIGITIRPQGAFTGGTPHTVRIDELAKNVMGQVPRQGMMSMRLSPELLGLPEDYQVWTIAHEIGHWFGLRDRYSKKYKYNIMGGCDHTSNPAECPVNGNGQNDIEKIWRFYNTYGKMNIGVPIPPSGDDYKG